MYNLFVVGGNDANKDVEIINLRGSGITCEKPANCLHNSYDQGMFFDGHSVVCSGAGALTKCYEYNVQVKIFYLSKMTI